MRHHALSRRSVLLGLGAAGLTAVAGCEAPWSGEEFPRWERTPVWVNALAGHTGAVTCTAFSSDGRRLATGGWDGKVLLWEAVTGKPDGAPITLDGPVTTLAFTPDGATLAISKGLAVYDVEFWDVARRTRTGKDSDPPLRHTSRVAEVAFTPDGKTFATAASDGVRLWNPADPRRHAFPPDPDFGPSATWKAQSEVTTMTLSQDGGTLAVATAAKAALQPRRHPPGHHLRRRHDHPLEALTRSGAHPPTPPSPLPAPSRASAPPAAPPWAASCWRRLSPTRSVR